jgi:integrase
MHIRNDVVVSKNPNSRNLPWVVRWWGKYDLIKEKQPRHSKSFTTKRRAEKYAQTLKDDICDGISVEPKQINLGNLCKKVLIARQGTIKPATLKTYNNTTDRLMKYFGSHRNIKTITKEEAEAFLSDITLLADNSGPSDSTRAKQHRNSRMIFNKAIDWNHIRKNPFKGITLGEVEKEDWHCITPAEFNALIDTIKSIKLRKNKYSTITEIQDLHNKITLIAFYTIMYDCGLRFGEAINLLWSNGNIDFINSKINIQNRSSKNGLPPFSIKNHEARTVPCTKRVIESLKELKEIGPNKNPYVFLSDDRYKTVKKNWQKLVSEENEGRWRNDMMVRNTNRKFKKYCKKAGVVSMDRLSVHCLRKGYGTNLANLGTPVHTLKELMGHSNIKTTMEYYIKSSDANKMKAVEGLEGLVGE